MEKEFTYDYIPDVLYRVTTVGDWPLNAALILYKVYRGDILIAETRLQIEHKDQITYIRDKLTEILAELETLDKDYADYCAKSEEPVNDDFNRAELGTLGESWSLE